MRALDMRVWMVVGIVVLGWTGPVGAEENWGGKWEEKLAGPYEEWKPLKDVLAELARQAGAEVVYGVDAKGVSVEPTVDAMVPLPAGLTRRQAFQAAAGVAALKGVWENGKVTVVKSERVASWRDLIGAEGKLIQVDPANGSLLLPRGRKLDRPIPWVWYAPNGPGPANAWTIKRLLDEGIAVAYVNVGESAGNPKGRAVFTAFYEKLTAEHGLARRAVLLPQSRGGLMLYNWAAEHPDAVAAIGGIYTVGDLRSYPGMKTAATAYGMTEAELTAKLPENNPIERLAPLVKARVPIFHVHGDKDSAVPMDKNGGEIVKRYKALGGGAELLVIPGQGHQVTKEFFQCQKLVDFLVKQAKESIK